MKHYPSQVTAPMDVFAAAMCCCRGAYLSDFALHLGMPFFGCCSSGIQSVKDGSRCSIAPHLSLQMVRTFSDPMSQLRSLPAVACLTCTLSDCWIVIDMVGSGLGIQQKT